MTTPILCRASAEIIAIVGWEMFNQRLFVNQSTDIETVFPMLTELPSDGLRPNRVLRRDGIATFKEVASILSKLPHQHGGHNIMGSAPWGAGNDYAGDSIDGSSTNRPASFHRIRTVREQQGVTIRTISRRTGVAMRDLRQEEKPTTDVSVSVLQRWAEALGVPLSELLVEPDMRLSQSIAHRAKLVRVMKTVLSLIEHGGDERTKRLSENLRGQMLDLMPELKEVTSWPSFGTRRPQDEMGRIGQEPISLSGINIDALQD
ncbi:MAG: helix-turn-helix domain-containing protein [Pirellulaceae bacterium]